jgi:biopolymer transport protein ExbB/TolQ
MRDFASSCARKTGHAGVLMTSPVTMFQHGGPIMFVLLLWALLVFVAQLAQFVLAKKVDFTPLLWSGLFCTVLLGMLGSMMGMSEAFGAVASASPEMKQVMLASGATVAMTSTMFSLLIAIPQAILTGIAATAVRMVRARSA